MKEDPIPCEMKPELNLKKINRATIDRKYICIIVYLSLYMKYQRSRFPRYKYSAHTIESLANSFLGHRDGRNSYHFYPSSIRHRQRIVDSSNRRIIIIKITVIVVESSSRQSVESSNCRIFESSSSSSSNRWIASIGGVCVRLGEAKPSPQKNKKNCPKPSPPNFWDRPRRLHYWQLRQFFRN